MKRFIVLTLICLVLGALTALGMAAATRAFLPLTIDLADGASWRPLETPGWDLTASRGLGVVFVQAWHRDEASDAITVEHPAMPRWCSFRHLPAKSSTDPDLVMMAFGCGWPFLCATESGAIEFDPDSTTTVSKSWFGIRFIWGGFIADTAIYAGLWMLLIRLPGALRYWRRKRRGLCLNCRYDLRGATSDVCSECGRDQLELARAARAKRRKFAVVVLLAACITIAYAAALSIQRSRAEREWGWFDEFASFRGMLFDMEDLGGFIDHVRSDPNHEDVFARRMADLPPELAQDVMWNVGELLSMLSDGEPRDSYLELADQFAELAGPCDQRDACFVYMNYPFPQVADRLLWILGSCEDPLTLQSAIIAAKVTWEREPAPERLPEMQAACDRLLAMNADASLTAYVLQWLLERELMSVDECEARLEQALANHSDQADASAVRHLRDLLEQRRHNPQ